MTRPMITCSFSRSRRRTRSAPCRRCPCRICNDLGWHRDASRSTCRSTSATSRWSTATSATRTGRSWARSRTRARAGLGRHGADRVRRRVPRGPHVIMGLANANSPMSWDFNMLGAAKVYAEDNQVMHHHAVHPGRRDGAGDRRPARRPRRSPRRWPAWRSADRAARRAGHLRLVRVVDVDAVGRADVRHAGAGARAVRAGRAAPAGSACRSAAAARSWPPRCPTPRRPTRSREQLQPTMLAGVNFMLHTAGWLEGGLAIGLREVHARRGPGGDDARVRQGRRPVARTARRSTRSSRTARAALPRHGAHAGQLRDRVLALERSPTTTASSSGSSTAALDAAQRANALWKKMLAEYEPPPLDEAMDEELETGWTARRRASPTPTSRGPGRRTLWQRGRG